MRARVIVRLKPEVSDPEGTVIGQALATLHYDAVETVRVGKIFDVELRETDRARAETELRKIAHDVLSNPTIEDFTFEILDDAGPETDDPEGS